MSYSTYAEDDRYAEAEEDPYRASRLLLAPEYRDLPDEQVAGVLQAAFPEMDPTDAENFFRNVGSAFNTAGRELIRRAPAIISSAGQGALAGGSVAGPYGALAGALGGAVLGGLGGGAPGARPPAPAPPGPTGAPRPPGAPGAGPGSAGRDLATLMAQPQTVLSVLTSLLRSAGRTTMPAGGGQMPVPAILGALSTLAARAAEDLGGEADDEEATSYLRDAQGNYVVDPADPDARAQRVLGVLCAASPEIGVEDYGDDYEYDETSEYEEDVEYDEDVENLEDVEDLEDIEP